MNFVIVFKMHTAEQKCTYWCCLTSHMLCFIFCLLMEWHNSVAEWTPGQEQREHISTSNAAPSNSLTPDKSYNLFRSLSSSAKWVECFQ